MNNEMILKLGNNQMTWEKKISEDSLVTEQLAAQRAGGSVTVHLMALKSKDFLVGHQSSHQ